MKGQKGIVIKKEKKKWTPKARATEEMPWCPLSFAGCKVKSKYNYMEDKDVKDRGRDSDQGSLAAQWHNMPSDPIKKKWNQIPSVTFTLLHLSHQKKKKNSLQLLLSVCDFDHVCPCSVSLLGRRSSSHCTRHSGDSGQARVAIKHWQRNICLLQRRSSNQDVPAV